jgi:hypothetical protein
MKRVEGFYWVDVREEGGPLVAVFRDGEWTLGTGEFYEDREDAPVVGGPLAPPADDVIATWKSRYDKVLKAYLKIEGKNALQGWDYLDGYYWVRVPGKPAPILAQYFEGWGAVDEVDGELFGEDVSVEILDGPLIPPQISPSRVA